MPASPPAPPPGPGLGGHAGRALGLLFGQPHQLSRGLARAGGLAGRRFLSHLGSVLRQIGLQLTGVAFLFFAAEFGLHGLQAWHAAQQHHVDQANGALLKLGLAVLFAYFGISSFFRAAQSKL